MRPLKNPLVYGLQSLWKPKTLTPVFLDPMRGWGFLLIKIVRKALRKKTCTWKQSSKLCMWVVLTAIISVAVKYKTRADKWLERYATLICRAYCQESWLCSVLGGHWRNLRANHILMRKERIEIKALRVTSHVLSSRIVSAKLRNTGL